MEANNNKAIREACKKTRDLLMRRGDGRCRCVLTWDEFNDTQKMLRAALDAPRLNCEVGTAEEQFERWKALCDKYDEDCTDCPLDKCRACTLAYCFARWSQMPYDEGETK